MTNAIELDYTHNLSDQIAHERVLIVPSYAHNHYFWVCYWGVVAALGLYVSIASNAIFSAAMFATMYGFYLSRTVPYSRVRRSWQEQAQRFGKKTQIHLRVDEEGMHETIDGQIESFAPWSAFRRSHVTDEYVFIELAGELWANIPRSSVVQGADAVDELVAILRSRGVPDRPRDKTPYVGK
jgi:hypothetical protein